MTGVRKPVENPSRRLGEMISASWFSTVSLSPWKAPQKARSFPHSHSPKRLVSITNTHLRACGAPKKGAQSGRNRIPGFIPSGSSLD